MLFFRQKQEKIENYPINQLSSLGLSKNFIRWYLKEWIKKNFKEVDKNTKENSYSKVKI
jgi:hypothetical protein